MGSPLQAQGVRLVVEGLSKYKTDLSQADKATKKSGDELTRMERVSAKAESAIKSFSTVGTLALAGAGVAATKMAVDFDRAFRNVQTLFPGTEHQIAGLDDKVLKLSNSMGVNATGSVNALYDAISAGVPADNALSFLEDATKTAIGGSIEAQEAVNVLTSTINAFGLSSADAGKVSDILFTTVARGKTTMGELARSMFNVAPAAGAAGISLEEVAGALASITKNGVPTATATTSLRQAIVELQKPGSELKSTLQSIGFESGTAALEALGLQGTLVALAEGAEANGKSMTQVFSSVEAGTAVLALTGEKAQIAADDLAAMGQAAGTTEAAFKTMNESTSRQFEIATERIKGNATAIALDLLPAVTGLLDAISGLTASFAALDPEQQKLIAGVGAMVIVLPKLASAMGLSATKALGLSAAIGGIAIAADLILEKTTGAGLVDRIFGDVARGESAERASKAVNDLLYGAADGTERVARSLDRLKTIGGAGKPEQGVVSKVLWGNDARLFGFDVGATGSDAIDAFKDIEEEVRTLATSMSQSGATARDYSDALSNLSPDLQKVFLDTIGLSKATVEHQATVERAKEVIDGWRFRIMDAAAAVGELPPALSDGKQAVVDFTEAATNAETGAVNFTEAIGNLHAAFSAMNPEVIALRAEQAFLAEELGDIKRKGDEATEAELERARVIDEELIPALEDRIAKEDENQQAIEATSQHLQLLIGPAGYGALLEKLREMNVDNETQIDIMRRINDAFATLETDGVPAAIGALEELKGELDPETWGVLAAALAPAITGSIASGFDPTNAEIVALVATANRIGGDLGEGIIAGLHATAVARANAVIETVNSILGPFKSLLGIDSPSRVMADEVGRPIGEGVAKGIIDSLPAAQSAIEQFIDLLTRSMDSGSEEVAREAGNLAEKTLSMLSERMDPNEAEAIADAFLDALSDAWSGSGVPEAIADEYREIAKAIEAGEKAAAAAASAGSGTPGPTRPQSPQSGAARRQREAEEAAGGATGTVTFSTGAERRARINVSGRVEYETAPGRWVTLGAADDHDPRSGRITFGGNKDSFYTPFHSGTSMVPNDMIARLERGEAVIPAAMNPYNTAMPSQPQPGGGGGGRGTYVDLRGSTFTGSPQENADAIADAVRRALDNESGRGAFIAGVPVAR